MMHTHFSAYALTLFFSLISTHAVMAGSPPPNDGAQIILRDKEQDTCTLDVPAAGSGLTYRYELMVPGTKCRSFLTRSIEFIQLPSALRIFMSDDGWCSENTTELDQRFWIKLKTTKKATTVGINEITYLLTYKPNTIIGPGLMMEDSYEKVGGEVRDNLSCIKLVASRAFDTPWPPAATDRDRSWSPFASEDLHAFSCPTDTIMTGRQHNRDESGNTRYECATAVQSGASVAVQDKVWAAPLTESDGIYFVCPNNRIMTGRGHYKDENGNTRYECATASHAGRNLTVTPHEWGGSMSESNSEFHCPADQFLIGRRHTGDENGYTRYRCATLQ
ncbi:hypothetical protein HU749_022375 [Pseudomonas ogarae]|uniref:hypothetical protein n=1 Tax=Pseudomonas ogarae (strain DSM 112162 / CECT 30235 / F113) TaxID=1114970 RepID=UPI00164886D8|nr:hypothetical protein [Pseudomonas zarinae]QXH93563.1 hypothetical protein HU749_022375 [Pseudomonas zarinae]